MRKPLEINALSRTTRGVHDKPVYVCSDCGTDEGFEEFTSFATPQTEWPISARTFGSVIDQMNVEYLNRSVAL